MFKPGKKLLTLVFKNFAGMKIIFSLLTTFLFAIKKNQKTGFSSYSNDDKTGFDLRIKHFGWFLDGCSNFLL